MMEGDIADVKSTIIKTPHYHLRANFNRENHLTITLTTTSPPKTFEQIISQEKMPDRMKTVFGSLQNLYSLIKNPDNIDIF